MRITKSNLVGSKPKGNIVKKQKFRSKLEANFNDRFNLPYEKHKLAYTVEHNYTPDFYLAQDTFVETKGLFLGADRNKHLYIRAQHPNVRVLFVFQNPNIKLSKKSKTSYADWCNKNNFPFLHIDEIYGHSEQTLLEHIKIAYTKGAKS